MDRILSITKALADGNRLRVVMTLKGCGELCVCQITEMLDLATPTVSRHMSVLQQAGLVKSRKDSRWVYYRLSDAFPPLLMQWLKDGLTDSKDMARDKDKLNSILSNGLDQFKSLSDDDKLAFMKATMPHMAEIFKNDPQTMMAEMMPICMNVMRSNGMDMEVMMRAMMKNMMGVGNMRSTP